MTESGQGNMTESGQGSDQVPEGIDNTPRTGSDEYPLDSVCVRIEQRAASQVVK